MQAKNTLNQLNRNEKALSKDLKKVASGMKINSAADDASGLSISERMDVQIRSLEQDDANTQNANSLMKVAEGAMNSTTDILKTLKEKVINAANDTNTDADRQIIQKELNQAIDQIDENANVTYNGKIMLDGSHNAEVLSPGTYTHLTNESLAENTNGYIPLTYLESRDGDNLGIKVGDTVTVSYVKNGKPETQDIKVDAMTNFGDLFTWSPCVDDLMVSPTSESPKIGTDQFGNDVYTADGKNAISYMAQQPGVDGQIAGLTLCVKDNEGVVRKSTNRILDNFTETIRAQNPSEDNSMTFQIGTKANQSIKVGFTDMRSEALGLKGTNGKKLDITSQAKANVAINVLDNALGKVLNQQTTLGALQSRMLFTSANINTASENTQASMSIIRDADMAKEMTAYTKDNVLMQASQSMLAQANQNSSSVLSLLQ
jgi:flagellin